MTPPPSAMTRSLRSIRCEIRSSQSGARWTNDFVLSPGGSTMVDTCAALSLTAATAASRCRAATFLSLTIATLAPGRNFAIRAPSEASWPRPITMS